MMQVRAHNKAWCPETSPSAFMRQDWAPGYQNCEPALAEKNGTGKRDLVSGKSLLTKSHYRNLKFSTAGPFGLSLQSSLAEGGGFSRLRGGLWNPLF